MAQTMVERVARAIAADQCAEVWQAFLPAARAAMGAMRDPSAAMLAAAAWVATVETYTVLGTDGAADAWARMIEAALTEGHGP